MTGRTAAILLIWNDQKATHEYSKNNTLAQCGTQTLRKCKKCYTFFSQYCWYKNMLLLLARLKKFFIIFVRPWGVVVCSQLIYHYIWWWAVECVRVVASGSERLWNLPLNRILRFWKSFCYITQCIKYLPNLQYY